ncbi:hypothetical protein [Streptomyces sp. NRRL F-2580]|nr:hypothetical protein [Streptomyces sp. NRRL F-2580]
MMIMKRWRRAIAVRSSATASAAADSTARRSGTTTAGIWLERVPKTDRQ